MFLLIFNQKSKKLYFLNSFLEKIYLFFCSRNVYLNITSFSNKITIIFIENEVVNVVIF